VTETGAGDARTESTAARLARVRASFDRQGMMTTLGVEVIAVRSGQAARQNTLCPALSRNV